MNGITVHGVQSTGENLRGLPASYYHPSGPLGQLLGVFGGQFSRIGAIGLGAGSIAAYAAPNDQLDFYEIDEAVIEIAETPALFSFLQQARERGVHINTIAGDARLTLNLADVNRYDVLVIDAFSSGSIPVHLMTREALSMYQSKLAGGGVLAFHISNHYLDFKGPLCDLAVDASFACLYRIDPELTDEQRGEGKSTSEWLVMTRDFNIANGLLTMGWQPREASGKALWRDNYSNIFDTLRRQ